MLSMACRRAVRAGAHCDEGGHVKAFDYPDSMNNKPVPIILRRTSIGLILFILPAMLIGCSRVPVKTQPKPASVNVWPLTTPANPEAANEVVMRALSLVGTPYRFGGNTPESGFDCSGLVSYVYRDALDLRLPRTSYELAVVQGPKIDAEQLTTGDLVFFGSARSVTHVGIYLSEGRFVHAPSSGGTVRLDRLDTPYWRDHYTGAKRVLR
ncbi:C40 family peptidase [Xylella fastidiosa]|uniref:C40 family peptidase n=1 Tax=Xylella fastidiosa TaxID=2371 RepID=A0ABC8AGX5_XYLFS|nr:C40 family peptidase [Xylella fastidiosa]ALR07640.2 C40 family peptidase [Xylella fastidiosa]